MNPVHLPNHLIKFRIKLRIRHLLMIKVSQYLAMFSFTGGKLLRKTMSDPVLEVFKFEFVEFYDATGCIRNARSLK